jgi:hypothetical protein
MEFGKRIENKKKQNERGEVKSRRLRTAYIPLSPCSCVCVLVCALYKEKQPFRLLSNRRGQQQPAQGRRRRVTITIWQKNKMLLRVLLSLSPIYLYSRCLGGPLLFIHFPPSTPSSLRLLLLFPLVLFSYPPSVSFRLLSGRRIGYVIIYNISQRATEFFRRNHVINANIMDLHHHILDANSQQYRPPQSAFLNFLPPKNRTWQLNFA